MAIMKQQRRRKILLVTVIGLVLIGLCARAFFRKREVVITVPTELSPPRNLPESRYTARIPSKVKIEGTSTIHDWEVTGGTIGGSMELPDLKSASPGKVNAKATVRIPVKTLKSSTGPAMDNIMYEAMKVPPFRFIDFRLSELVLKEAKSPNGPYKFDSTGDLTICGVTNKINMPITIEMFGTQPQTSRSGAN